MRTHISLNLLIGVMLLLPFPGIAQKSNSDTARVRMLLESAAAYSQQAQWDSALVLYQQAEGLCEKKKSWDTYLIARNGLASALRSLGLGDSGMAVQQKNVALARRLLKPDHPTVGLCYNQLAVFLIDRSQYDSALSLLVKAADILKKKYSENHLDVSQVYNNLLKVYYITGNIDQALFYAEKTLNIRRHHLGENHTLVAASYSNMAVMYEIQGKYAEAISYNAKALAVYISLTSEYHPAVANIYENIGGLYLTMGLIDSALYYTDRALLIRRTVLKAGHPDISKTHLSLALSYSSAGLQDSALRHVQTATEFYRNTYGENHLGTAECYQHTAIIYQKRSEFDLAIEYTQKALSVFRSLFGENHEKTAMCYNNLGVLADDKKEYALAVKYYRNALNIYRAIYADNNYRIANSLNNLGLAYENLGLYDSAKTLLDESMKMRQQLFGDKNYYTAQSHCNIGNLYIKMNDYAEAEKHLLIAVRQHKELFGDKNSPLSQNFYDLAALYQLTGRLSDALRVVQLSLYANIRALRDTADLMATPPTAYCINPILLLETVDFKARLLYQSYRQSRDIRYLYASLKHFDLCDTLIDAARRSIVSLSDKITLSETSTRICEGALEAYNEAAVTTTDPNAGKLYRERIFYFSEKNKAGVLMEALAGAEALKFSGIPDSLLQLEHHLKTRIKFYERQLAEDPDSLSERLFRDILFDLNRRYDHLIKKFEDSYPAYYELKYTRKPVALKDIQKLLDKKTALISFFTGDSLISRIMVTANTIDVSLFPKEKTFEDSLRLYLKELSGQLNLKPRRLIKRLGYKYYTLLLPSEAKRYENLIIIPDGILSMVPFETFLTEPSIKVNKYSKLPYLIKRHAVSYSYSANLFYRTFQKSGEIEIRNLHDWLALAPVFNDDNNAGMTFRTRYFLQKADPACSDTSRTRGRMIQRDRIAPLPGTLEEVNNIFRLFDASDRKAMALLQKSARESFIKSDSVRNFRYIHLATHGFVNIERPELSGILLTLDSTDTEDGILFMGEIYSLHLNADLTVLSACETGLGQVKKGEGLIGLTRALLYAGSKNLLVSLWKVADQSTANLMFDFYKQHLKAGPKGFATALRDAKLKLLKQSQLGHPFYWSPFILIGR